MDHSLRRDMNSCTCLIAKDAVIQCASFYYISVINEEDTGRLCEIDHFY